MGLERIAFVQWTVFAEEVRYTAGNLGWAYKYSLLFLWTFALVELWGGRVVMAEDELTEKQPTAPIEFTKDLSCPLLGLFGNEDRSPTPEQVDQHEAELKKHGKDYEFHRYDGAGHGFFYYDRPMYRIEQALDGWQKVFAFLQKNLAE